MHQYVLDDQIVNIRACILRRQVRRERTELKTRHRNETIHAWKYSEEYANVCTCNGRWLFSPRNKKYEHCISMLRQQLCHEQAVEKRGEEYKSRMWEEQCRGQTNDANMNNWLFLRKGSDVRAMKQLLYAYEEQRIRQRKQRRLVQEMEALGNESCVSWLFLPNKTGCKILSDMYDAVRRHYKRMRSRAIKKEEYDNGVELFVQSGSWMYQKKNAIESRQHLIRLYKHVSKSRSKAFQLMVNDVLWYESADEMEAQMHGCNFAVFPQSVG